MSTQNLHRPGLTTPFGLRRAKVGFGWAFRFIHVQETTRNSKYKSHFWEAVGRFCSLIKYTRDSKYTNKKQPIILQNNRNIIGYIYV